MCCTRLLMIATMTRAMVYRLGDKRSKGCRRSCPHIRGAPNESSALKLDEAILMPRIGSLNMVCGRGSSRGGKDKIVGCSERRTC